MRSHLPLQNSKEKSNNAPATVEDNLCVFFIILAKMRGSSWQILRLFAEWQASLAQARELKQNRLSQYMYERSSRKTRVARGRQWQTASTHLFPGMPHGWGCHMASSSSSPDIVPKTCSFPPLLPTFSACTAHSDLALSQAHKMLDARMYEHLYWCFSASFPPSLYPRLVCYLWFGYNKVWQNTSCLEMLFHVIASLNMTLFHL